jgi:ribokinase
VIVVVGSINMDVVAEVDHAPMPGETVLARAHWTAHGGKGANQAVAAARLGGDVHFVGCVGSDAHGDELRRDLAAEGVDIGSLAVSATPTGFASITVDPSGENAIVVGTGANDDVVVTAAVADLLARADVVLSQLEIPITVVADAAAATGGLFVLNAAPARELPGDLLASVDVLVANEHEIVALAGAIDPASIRELGVPTVVTTLGARGAHVVTTGDSAFVPAIEVPVRDTTGAGDAFCGALAHGLDAGLDVFDATARAVVAGSLATTMMGARSGMTDLAGLERASATRRRSE